MAQAVRRVPVEVARQGSGAGEIDGEPEGALGSSGARPAGRTLRMKPLYFKSPSAFREWLEENHDRASELWVGFYKKGSGRPSITYHEALDEALCFGWIDGVRKSLDEASYTNRFTPRKPGSNWSEVNVKRVGELEAQGRMRPPGIAAFERRDPEKTKQYSYEERSRELAPAYQKSFRANRKAWDFWSAQPPGYRRVSSWFVMSAKKEETRQKRLARLIDTSERGERLAEVAKPLKPQKT
jgi:uncharacterized protein YdeI (YjbR/CyaY-like superfamily)